jgi:hypothetical protein
MVSAFDPASCALFVHVAEQAALTCLCPIKRPRMIPRARRWLRRNSERAFEVVMEDVAESALDVVNSVEPGIALALILLLWLRVMVVAKESKTDDQSQYV